MDLLLKAGRVIDPAAGLDEVVDIAIADGRISEIGRSLAVRATVTVACEGRIVMPGLVDPHVHLREPGREYAETIATGTRAAAHGGFTAVCSMPNTTPVCDNGSVVRFVKARAAESGAVRVYPLGALSKGSMGEALAEIGHMVAEGAVGFTDDGHGVGSALVMRQAMEYASGFDTVVASHCEDAALAGRGVVNEGVVSTRLGLPGIPVAAEEIHVARDIRLAELTGCRLHLQHLSTARSVEYVREAKRRGLPVTCEASPHHLVLDESAMTDAYETNLKMNPPLRTAEDREALVAALLDGTIDCIASDHAPHGAHEKAREFELAPFGTTGLETSLPLVLTHFVHTNIIDYAAVVALMAIGPRRCFSLPQIRLEPGTVADITVVDPDAAFQVTPEWFVSRSSNSAFLGAALRGRATDVLVEGRFALRDGRVVD